MARKTENCLNSKCNNAEKIPISEFFVAPFDIEHEELKKLFSYFLYRAPNISSAHSPEIDSSIHQDLFAHMMEGRHFKYQEFCSANIPIENELAKSFLLGTDICFKCKRFLCKYKKYTNEGTKETELECFLRHIRNSIAHGRVFYRNNKNRIQIMFEDENTTGKLSARIVCIKADLEHWKKILSRKIDF